MSDADGYCAIVISDQDLWLGLSLDHAQDFSAGRLVGALECGLDELGAEIASGEAYADLDNHEQAIVGILSTLLAIRFANAELAQVPIVASAIALLTGHRFFWVEGELLANGGYNTTLGILKARTVLDAQLEVVALPPFSALIHRR